MGEKGGCVPFLSASLMGEVYFIYRRQQCVCMSMHVSFGVGVKLFMKYIF